MVTGLNGRGFPFIVLSNIIEEIPDGGLLYHDLPDWRRMGVGVIFFSEVLEPREDGGHRIVTWGSSVEGFGQFFDQNIFLNLAPICLLDVDPGSFKGNSLCEGTVHFCIQIPFKDWEEERVGSFPPQLIICDGWGESREEMAEGGGVRLGGTKLSPWGHA